MALPRKAAQTTALLLARNARIRSQPIRRLHASTSRHEPEPNPVVNEDGELKVTAEPAAPLPEPKEGWFYVDSVFPIRIGQWDLRHYVGVIRADTLNARLEEIFSSVHTHGFAPLKFEAHPKDGGVFVRFRYTPGPGTEADVRDALKDIRFALEKEAAKRGGIPNWIGLKTGGIWLVKGKPWNEDMSRFVSPILKVSFDGPDIQEEALYNLLRPYGRITDIAMPLPAPAGTLRSSTVTFRHLPAATIARNAIHGLDFEAGSGPSGNAPPRTRIRTAYQPPVQAHAIRDWLEKHPKIVFPIVVFLLGTFTYTVFDPIRKYMVEGKIMDWFDYREYDVFKWLQTGIVNHLPFLSSSSPATPSKSDNDPYNRNDSKKGHKHKGDETIWQERKDAQASLERYLNDLPTTVAFVHGPQGSGKTRMFTALAQDSNRRTLVLDCAELLKHASDADIVNSLSRQTGYWPVFTFMNSMNTWLDIASVGVIGQKAGLSTSLPAQVQQVIGVVGSALAGVSESYRAQIEKQVRKERLREEREEEERRRKERVKRGEWHDGRLDCVAGNGVMSELGVGDERLYGWEDDEPAVDVTKGKHEADSEPKLGDPDLDEKKAGEPEEHGDATAPSSITEKVEGWRASLPNVPSLSSVSLPSVSLPDTSSLTSKLFGSSSTDPKPSAEEKPDQDRETPRTPQGSSSEAEAVRALPILVIKNFGSRTGGNKDAEEVLSALATWAAGLAENQIAHVIVMSDNRENAKRVAKALPSKPLNTVQLSDADTASALSFVKQKLHDADIHVRFDQEETTQLERLGGRASDLESLVHKVRSGQTIKGAVEDIVHRDVGELRKNAFGDDAEDAKNLPWTREQAWQLFKQLTKKGELPYYEVLVEMFKNDETALRNMEHAELIAINTENGRPSTIRPGKPVYKYVFQRLVSDTVFRATQDLAVNDKNIASAESVVRACEDELLRLRELGSSRTARRRENFLLDKMHAAQVKIEGLETQNVELKKVLAKGG